MIKGYISNFDGENITIIAPYSDARTLAKQQVTECEIILDDGRHISAQQRRFIYALIGYISDWTGYIPDECKQVMKYQYVSRTGAEDFSLSDINMTAANEFLEFIIRFVVENGIPTKDNLINCSPDIARYVYMCLENKKCCICGKKADIHHVDRVGMGRNRKEICHIGMNAQSLCRIHHGECHEIGQITFDEKYHVCAVKIDEWIAKIYKLKGEEKD